MTSKERVGAIFSMAVATPERIGDGPPALHMHHPAAAAGRLVALGLCECMLVVTKEGKGEARQWKNEKLL